MACDSSVLSLLALLVTTTAPVQAARHTRSDVTTMRISKDDVMAAPSIEVGSERDTDEAEGSLAEGVGEHNRTAAEAPKDLGGRLAFSMPRPFLPQPRPPQAMSKPRPAMLAGPQKPLMPRPIGFPLPRPFSSFTKQQQHSLEVGSGPSIGYQTLETAKKRLISLDVEFLKSLVNGNSELSRTLRDGWIAVNDPPPSIKPVHLPALLREDTFTSVPLSWLVEGLTADASKAAAEDLLELDFRFWQLIASILLSDPDGPESIWADVLLDGTYEPSSTDFSEAPGAVKASDKWSQLSAAQQSVKSIKHLDPELTQAYTALMMQEVKLENEKRKLTFVDRKDPEVARTETAEMREHKVLLARIKELDKELLKSKVAAEAMEMRLKSAVKGAVVQLWQARVEVFGDSIDTWR